MKQLGSRKPWWLMVLAATALLIPIGYYALRRLDMKTRSNLLEHKGTRETTATVKAKGYVRFDSSNRSYVNDLNQWVEMHPGDEQWRIYYQIDNFDQIHEPVRSRLLKSENERAANKRLRFRHKSREWYERTGIGDKLVVTYRWLGDDMIEIPSVTNPKFPSLP